MMFTDIVRQTRRRIVKLPRQFPETLTRDRISLVSAVENRKVRNAIIAEIKRASPSRGIIRRDVDIPAMASILAGSGCVALSVLTEPDFFGGSGADIAGVRSAVDIPILRKDFIIDERQVAESRALGADAVLLIAGVLGKHLPSFVDLVKGYGLEPLVEVHTRGDAESALTTDAELIGINNRDLATLLIDRSTTRVLSGLIRSGERTVISESGILTGDHIRELKPYCDAFLVGTSIMADDNPERRLEEFVCA